MKRAEAKMLFLKDLAELLSRCGAEKSHGWLHQKFIHIPSCAATIAPLLMYLGLNILYFVAIANNLEKKLIKNDFNFHFCVSIFADIAIPYGL